MRSRVFQIGIHVSIAGGFARAPERAAALACTVFQIFPQSPRGWQARPATDDDVQSFRAAMKKLRLKEFFIHMPYLPNLATPDPALYEKSVAALIAAVKLTAHLGGRYVITHLGSHKGAGAEAGRERVAAALARALAATTDTPAVILMENAAGKGHQLGLTFPEINELHERVSGVSPGNRRRLGLCLDTCHAHAMGYDLSARGDGAARLAREIAAGPGLAALKAIHLNDARGAAGSGLDRHEHIGRGTIGREGFRRFINDAAWRDVPMVMETPQENSWDKKNLRLVRKLRES
jgi:deoxyribonuclease-4